MVLLQAVKEKMNIWLEKELQVYGFQSNKPLTRMILLVLEKNQDSFESLREKLTAPLAEFFTHGMEEFIQRLWLYFKKVRREKDSSPEASDSDSYSKSRENSRKRTTEFDDRSYNKRKKSSNGDSDEEDEQSYRNSQNRRERSRYSGRNDYNNRRNRRNDYLSQSNDNQNEKKRDKNNQRNQFSKSSRFNNNNGDNFDEDNQRNYKNIQNNDFKFRKQQFNSQKNGNSNANSSWIHVTNIPKENFSISPLDEYFKRFGQINQVRLNTGTGSAFIQFGDPSSAKKAYKSPEAVFGNRFIKLFFVKDNPGDNSTNLPTNKTNNNKNNTTNNTPNNNNNFHQIQTTNLSHKRPKNKTFLNPNLNYFPKQQ